MTYNEARLIRAERERRGLLGSLKLAFVITAILILIVWVG
jgi:hypothetical protein